MRLLNATTWPLQFEVFYGNPPPYAILSHTWGSENEEVTFQDVRSRDRAGKSKLGYQKIKACCDRAVRDGLRYINSVELQEAIHSMFNWYKRSTICYAYLFDYAEASKWFTRGWTLQELIAPVKVLFYSRNWVSVGSKTELGDLILRQDLEHSSVAQRMSWASMRTTTRAEDIA
ncbi:hypothetical protein F5882DRAFT_426825 [Hyaloscypha sp. PMI_1271]|nr:hypothetical protein F5882DRAFT_426825 [Hyaloscypha sp. PMI_1271]